MNDYKFITTALQLAFILPLISFILSGIIQKKFAQYSSVILMIIAATLFDIVCYKLYYLNHDHITLLLWEWLDIPNYLKANIAIHLDVLSGVMGFVVLNISALVHIYSLEYMSHDKKQEKFIAYLSLFTFFMLILILSDNLLQLFIGWEGVGLCSYLLIGFWYQKKSANHAAIKAFVVNRIGDVGLILAMSLILMTFKSLDFSFILSSENIAQVMQQEICCMNMIDCICLLLFIGCMGKSAQIILHVWLPDAMEGPTPVSALIHAATMVTAGVFLIARCSILFEHSLITLNLIAIIGTVTAVFAATIALVQNDIKRIIAYSTCSQLGYMFFACGISAYAESIFHLFTHAFFKALLFLSAGSVIHGMNGEQDIHKMGGLRKYMPITYLMMLIGSFALGGIFPFAGFFSKDAILERAYFAKDFVYYGGIFAALLTAFYSWRLIILVFDRKREYTQDKPHESGIIILLPLMVLAIGAIASGWFGRNMLKVEFWRNSLAVNNQIHLEISQVIEFLPLIVGVFGILFAYSIYGLSNSLAHRIQLTFSWLYKLLQRGYFFDYIYDLLFVRFFKLLSKMTYRIFDMKVIDTIPRTITAVIGVIGQMLKALHNGNVQTYITMFFGFLAITFYEMLSEISTYDFWILALVLISLYLTIIFSKQKNV